MGLFLLPQDEQIQIHGFEHPTLDAQTMPETLGVAHCNPLHSVVTARSVEGEHGHRKTMLEVLDTDRQTVREIELPCSMIQDDGKQQGSRWDGHVTYSTANLVSMFAIDDGLATVDCAGTVRLWELSPTALAVSVEKWKRMIGGVSDPNFEIKYSNLGKRKELERFSGLGNDAPKHGKEDPDNTPHVGGNTWAGGTGGRDTAGLGGKGVW